MGPRWVLPWLVAAASAAAAQTAGPSAAAAQPATTPAATATAPDPAALVEEGRRRYTGMCARCHGLNLVTTGIGFDLRRFPRDEKERFVRSINKGIKAMPAFEGHIKPAEIDALWAYVGAINGWAP
jgi:mono/diheme cytochrome c family protein